jgi:hypothetical protein
MASAKRALTPGARVLLTITWILLLLWAAWWIVGKLMLVTSPRAELGPLGIVEALLIPIVIVVIVLVSIRWPLLGGILLIIEAVIAWFQFDMGFEMIFKLGELSVLTLTLPAFVIGILLIICWQAARAPQSGPA